MQSNLADFKAAVGRQADRLRLDPHEYGANQIVGSDSGELITAVLHFGRDHLDGTPDELVALMAEAQSREHFRQLFCGKLPLGRTVYDHAERLGVGTLELNVFPLADSESPPGSPLKVQVRNVIIEGPREQVIMLMQDADSIDHLLNLARQRNLRPR